MDLIYMVQDRDSLRALVNVVMNVWCHKMGRISSLVESRFASQEGLCSM